MSLCRKGLKYSITLHTFSPSPRNYQTQNQVTLDYLTRTEVNLADSRSYLRRVTAHYESPAARSNLAKCFSVKTVGDKITSPVTPRCRCPDNNADDKTRSSSLVVAMRRTLTKCIAGLAGASSLPPFAKRPLSIVPRRFTSRRHARENICAAESHADVTRAPINDGIS